MALILQNYLPKDIVNHIIVGYLLPTKKPQKKNMKELNEQFEIYYWYKTLAQQHKIIFQLPLDIKKKYRNNQKRKSNFLLSMVKYVRLNKTIDDILITEHKCYESDTIEIRFLYKNKLMKHARSGKKRDDCKCDFTYSFRDYNEDWGRLREDDGKDVSIAEYLNYHDEYNEEYNEEEDEEDEEGARYILQPIYPNMELQPPTNNGMQSIIHRTIQGTDDETDYLWNMLIQK